MYPPFPKRIIGPTPWMLGIGWSLTMAVLCTLAHYNLKQARDDLALREASAILQSDMAYHLWATEARGLYVAPGPEMPADPQLAGSPRRDILTRSGQLLTLVTPDYMAQLVQDHPVQAGRARSHIVHANPSSGHPRADEWELTALHRLSSAQPEISEIVTENNVRRLRLLAAIPSSSAAPRADDEPVQHALSITLPLPPVWSGPRADDARLAIAGLGAFWLLGIAGLIYTTQRYQKHRHAREARIEALRLSEERFKQLYEHAPIAYQILDAELHLTAVNDAWLQLFGYKKSDVLGHPLTHFVSPAFQSQATTAIQHLATTELVQSVELVFQHKDGHPLTLAIQGRAAPDARTGQTTLHCVLHNITEQRRTEVALRESERRYRLLSENIGDLITLYDFRAGRFTYVSPSVNHLLGRTVEETLHGSMQDFLSPKSYAFFTEHIGPRLATFERDAASRQPLTREIELMHKDGRVIFCEVTINILPDSEGRYTLMVSVCHDISERKRIAERLQESEERFRHIIEHAQAGYFRIDCEGRYESVNQTWLRMHGYASAHEIIGQSYTITQTDRELLRMRTIMEHMRSGETIPTGEFTRRSKDGSIGYHSFSAAPVRRAGNIVGLEGFLIDTTALRRAQADYAALFNQMVDGFALQEMIFDAHGRPIDYRFLAVNPAFERLTGLTAADLVGRRVLEVMPDTEPFWIETYGKIVTTGQPISFEHHSNEMQRYFSVTAFRPTPGCFASITSDITARVLAEQSLARDEAELLSIYEHTPFMLMLVDETLTIRRANRAFLEFLQLEEQDVIGHPAPQFGLCQSDHTSSSRPCRDPRCGTCQMEHYVTETLSTGTPHPRIQLTPHISTATRDWEPLLRISTARITVDDRHLVVICLEDITQQHAAQTQLQRQAALLDISRDAICVLNLDYSVEYWNHGARSIYGWTADEALGSDWETLVFANESPEFRAAWTTLIEQGKWSGEFWHTTKHNQPVLVQSRWTLLRDDEGQPKSVLIVSTDITETKRLESQFLRAQRLDTIGSMASGIAHDLNNVFSPILMSVDMLRPLATHGKDRSIFQLLHDSAHRGAHIVQQLLLFGRGGDAHLESIALDRLVQEITNIIRETFPRHITYQQELPTDLWPIRGDATQIHQILLNLCINARDAMPNGGRLRIIADNHTVTAPLPDSAPDATPGPYVRLHVTDTGCGMPPDVLTRIFDPFFTTKPLGQGTGLGLATVREIIKKHGGFLTVESQVGTGSTFTVYLPARDLTEPQSSAPIDTTKLSGNGETILIVDDETSVQQMLQLALEGLNYRTLVANDGAEALALHTQNPDTVRLVIADMVMPNLPGQNTIRCLRQVAPRLPIIAISGLESEKAKVDALADPHIQFVFKPFSLEQITSAVRRQLDSRQP